jgi:hypothetical protein
MWPKLFLDMATDPAQKILYLFFPVPLKPLL